VPVVGAITNAATAAALTEFLAAWLDAHINNPNAPPPDISIEGLMKVFANATKRAEATTQ
jgi:hypothetical protein